MVEQSVDKTGGSETNAPSSGQGGNSQTNQTSHIVSLDEKKLRIQHNMALAEHFKNKAKDPFDLLEKLVEHHEKQVNGETVVSPAP